MTASPLVSIILRCKDEELWIGRFMQSLKAQHGPYDVEVVLVDNRSSDCTVARALSLYDRIKVVEIDRYIPGAALNSGLKEAQGEYVVCISAHCVPANENWLAELIAPLSNPEIAAVYGRQIPLLTSDPKDKRDLWLTFGLDDKIQSRDPFLHNANAAYRRKDLIVHPFSEAMTNIEDRNWASHELQQGRKIYYTASAVVYHDHGIHQTGSGERLNGVINMMDELHHRFDQFADYYGESDEMVAPGCCLIIPISDRYGDDDIDMLSRHVDELMDSFRNWTVYVLPTTAEHARIAGELGFNTLDFRIGSIKAANNPLVVDISNAVKSLSGRNEYYEYVATFDIRRWVPARSFIERALETIQIEQADAAIGAIHKPTPVFTSANGESLQMEYAGWLNWLDGFETTKVPVLDPSAFVMATMDVLRQGNPLQCNFCTVEIGG